MFTITTSLIVSLNKLGLQHSTIRFHSELSPADLVSNILCLVVMYSTVTTALFFVAASFLRGEVATVLFSFPALFFVIASAFVGAIYSVLLNFLIARQYSGIVATLNIVVRFLAITATVCTVLFILTSSLGVVIAQFMADVCAAFVVLLVCWRKKIFSGFSIRQLRWEKAKPLLLFGVPMYGYEMAHALHNYIDRYILMVVVPERELGIYSVVYNLATIIGAVLVGGVVTALVPMYLRVWQQQGRDATEALLRRANDLLLLTAPAIVAGLYAVGEPLLTVLTTPTYAAYYYLLPLIAVGTMLFSAMGLFAAGMQIKKDALKMFRFVVEGLAVNFALNMIFIPRAGILAAAIITVVSYSWIAWRYARESQQTLCIPFNRALALRAGLYAGVMVAALMHIHVSNPWWLVLSRLLAGVLIFVVCVLVGEPDVRRWLSSFLSRRSRGTRD